ncbi:MAG: hypothetical protein NVSMB51_11920 [Solirubrobacteraceae bacterium]
MHEALILLAASGLHEKSKTAFYLLGGALAVWAVVVSAIGFTKPDFPGDEGGARVVMGISAVLVVAATATAVLTASTPAPAAPFKVNTGYVKGQVAPPTAVAQPAAASPAAPPAPPGTLAIAADPTGQLKFDQTSLTAKAGKVTISFANASPVPHNFSLIVKGNVVATPTFAGGSKSLSATLTAGKYTYLCTVPGHSQAGMMGSLTVN